jgi:hypothetical protein
MQRGIAFILLLTFMLSHTELHQFFKIPVLFEHLSEHRKQDPSITFIQFIKLHYDKIVIDDDYQRDQQLPFRNADCAAVITIVTDIPPQIIKFEQREFRSLPRKLYARENFGYSHNFSNSIFQPPRQVA